MDTKQFTNNFLLHLWRHSTVVKWRENVILTKNVNFLSTITFFRVKIRYQHIKKLNIFTAEQLIIYTQTVKIVLFFYVCSFYDTKCKIQHFLAKYAFPAIFTTLLWRHTNNFNFFILNFGCSYLLRWKSQIF